MAPDEIDDEDVEDEPHIFSLEDAQWMVDHHVRETMDIIQTAKRDFDRLSAEIQSAEQEGGSNGHSSPISHIEVLRGKAFLARGTIEAKLANLRGVGVEVKSIDQGLVDFPHIRDGRLVYLCWQSGEGDIAYWHDLDAGFAGRQPL
jgi:hypothetical protein